MNITRRKKYKSLIRAYAIAKREKKNSTKPLQHFIPFVSLRARAALGLFTYTLLILIPSRSYTIYIPLLYIPPVARRQQQQILFVSLEIHMRAYITAEEQRARESSVKAIHAAENVYKRAARAMHK